ncbi:MAG: cytidylate kinase-like family protein [Lachnospiraceae bacterium]|nr:cytidylate kinase-like family protein [Lachnospiraceae bacterium]
MEKKKFIITIGRQYGSGGAEVGKKLGKQLGLEVYDKEILKMTSNESGIRESYFHLADERAGKKLLYKIVQSMVPENTSPSLGNDLVSSDNLFRFQSSVIRKLAQEQSCVFIGRCADHVLAGTENLVRVFIYADMDARIERIRQKGYYEEDEILKNIKRMDKERRDYHRYFTGKDWEALENYDLMLNSAKVGTDGCVACIIDYLENLGLLED